MTTAYIDQQKELIRAVKEKHSEVVQRLLEVSPDLIVGHDCFGMSALHWSSKNGDLEMSKLLMRAGAKVDIKCRFGMTPLHLAAKHGFLPVCQLLVENGADINANDDSKMTPLHWCVEMNQLSIVEYLCQSQAINVNHRDKFNRTCLSLAKINKNSAIVDLLVKKLNSDTTSVRETILKSDSGQQSIFFSQAKTLQQSGGVNNRLGLSRDEEKSLAEFYKKKSLVKSSSLKSSMWPTAATAVAGRCRIDAPSSSSSSSIFTDDFVSSGPSPSPSSSSSAKANENRSRTSCKQWDLRNCDDDETATSSEEDSATSCDEDASSSHPVRKVKCSSKKKRLSFSPARNALEDQLFRLKNSSASNSDYLLENRELSLTEAGVLTLEYLRKLDLVSNPIRDDKVLFLKLVKSLENSDKCENYTTCDYFNL